MTQVKNGKWLLWGSMILILILDSRCALEGSRAGLELCIRSVIPALFPFLVLGPIFTSALAGKSPGVLSPVCKALKLPQGGHALLIAGMLGGYPVGAQCIAGAVQRGETSREQGRRLMGFCCNCGPGFLFGICGQFFSSIATVAILWTIHILSALAVGLLLPGGQVSGRFTHSSQTKLTDAMQGAVRAMGMICGWVVMFRVFLEFIRRWVLWAVPNPLGVLISGVLELTNGCFLLTDVESPGLRFLLCEAMVSFGGICVTMQTGAVAGSMGLGMYLPGKLLQTGIAVLAAGLYLAASARNILIFGACATVLFTIFIFGLYFKGKIEKTSGNLAPLGV